MARSSGKREAILAAARRLGASGGRLGVDSVLEAAGAGVGTFYHHFPNGIGDLLAALAAGAAADYEESLLRVLQRNRDAETGVKALVHHHSRWIAEHAEAARLLPDRPSAELLVATRAWARSVGLQKVGSEELLAVTLGPLRIASGPDRLGAAAWAAVRALGEA